MPPHVQFLLTQVRIPGGGYYLIVVVSSKNNSFFNSFEEGFLKGVAHARSSGMVFKEDRVVAAMYAKEAKNELV